MVIEGGPVYRVGFEERLVSQRIRVLFIEFKANRTCKLLIFYSHRFQFLNEFHKRGTGCYG